MRRVCMMAAVLAVALVSWEAYAQGPSLVYYGAQIGGGTIAALAGGAAGTFIGGLSGVLLGLPIELARHPRDQIQIFYQDQDLSKLPALQEPVPMRWGIAGAKIGFGLGVSAGAALGVIWIGKLFGVEGDPHGAWTGAFAGTLAGVMLMTDITEGRYPFVLSRWHCKRTEQGERISFECGYESEYLSPMEVLLSPMVLAALGATVGYNAKMGFAVSMLIVSVSF